MSKVIISGRRTGKTTQAIKIANESKGYLIVVNETEKRRIREECMRNPVSFAEFNNDNMRGSWVRNIVIDNFDLWLEQKLNEIFLSFAALNIDAITATEKPEDVFRRVYGKFIETTN